MYLGRVVEEGPTADVLARPRHPYTRALMQSFPSFGRPLQAPLRGEIPSPIELPAGCRFASRCPDAREACCAVDPVLSSDAQGRRVACAFPLTIPETAPHDHPLRSRDNPLRPRPPRGRHRAPSPRHRRRPRRPRPGRQRDRCGDRRRCRARR
ncbi:MAG: oligopeptide/dipeptide ABC transporter ATP-binding protein, partial [Burkholderiaceae bacterium]